LVVIRKASPLHPLTVVFVVFLQPGEEFLPLLNVALMRGSTGESGVHYTPLMLLYQSALLLNCHLRFTLHHPEETDGAIFHPVFIEHQFGGRVLVLLVFIETLVERCLCTANIALIAFYASGVFSINHVEPEEGHWGDLSGSRSKKE
jgi:hypothetical protein